MSCEVGHAAAHIQMTQQEARMPHTAVASATRPSHTAECHTAARAEPKLPVPDAEGVPVMAESLAWPDWHVRRPMSHGRLFALGLALSFG